MRRLSFNACAMGVSALAAMSCGGASSPSESTGKPARHVVLISLDTTRADALGVYGSPAGASPRIDALAQESVVFENAMAAAPTTLAAHTSMFTGLYTHRHGVPRNGHLAHDANETLAERLAARGWATGAVVAAFPLASVFGLDQGFDLYDERISVQDPSSSEFAQRTAEEITDAALEVMDELADDPAANRFLFVHYFDVHAPYAPPSPYAEQFIQPGRPSRSTFEDLHQSVAWHQRQRIDPPPGLGAVMASGLPPELAGAEAHTPTPGDEHLRNLYLAELKAVDAHVGRLLDGLRERDGWDDTLVVLTADHGETFWEHGDLWNHGLWVYDTTVHVPLIMRVPGGVDGGRRVETPVSQVDLAPTILAWAGLDRDSAQDGVPLLPVDALGERGPVFSEATQGRQLEAAGEWFNRRKPRCARDGRWKYIEAPYLGLEQLFDLDSDPQEQRNRLPADDAETREAVAHLRAALEAWDAGASPHPTRSLAKEAAEVRKRLRALGYLDND